MTYIKNLMLVIVSAIMGTASASLFEGWSVTEQRIVFVVSVLMVAMMMAKSSTRSKSRKKTMQKRTEVKRKSRRGKRRSRGP
jgi:membrane protein implicated in regulation of membrane protease activity